MKFKNLLILCLMTPMVKSGNRDECDDYKCTRHESESNCDLSGKGGGNTFCKSYCMDDCPFESSNGDPCDCGNLDEVTC